MKCIRNGITEKTITAVAFTFWILAKAEAARSRAAIITQQKAAGNCPTVNYHIFGGIKNEHYQKDFQGKIKGDGLL